MPSLNQDFVRLEHDSFVLEYTSTDSILNASANPNPSYAAWWGLSDTNNAAGNLLLSSWSNNTSPYGIDSYDVSSGYPDCSTTGNAIALIPQNAPFLVEVFETKVIVLLQYSDFENVPTGDYYHELVLMKVVNGVTSVAHQCRSHVAATGILTVNESLFTNNPYR